MNQTFTKVIQVATILGAVGILIEGAKRTLGAKSVKEGIMPVVSIFVAVSAIKFSMEKPLQIITK